MSRLTGTNKEYVAKHIPHLNKLMVNHAEALIYGAEVIVVSSREKKYADLLLQTSSTAIIIDMVHLPEAIRRRAAYRGINW